jgi:1-deoxy-D-xylulose-5-phosphate reductoisomerase
MKNLAILGSTGSIGVNALKIVEMFPDRFKVKALTAATHIELLAKQIRQFKPEVAVVINEENSLRLKRILGDSLRVEILYGTDGYRIAASWASVDQVLAAMVGAAGLLPTLAAIEAGKDIALANKETLVMAGDIVMEKIAEKGVRLLPVDSEHSAIFQSISGNRRVDVEKIFLTASGGPFLNKPGSEFCNIELRDALRHPNWQMGKKISIDSATMMNKGLEIIEARHLFNISQEKIEVVIHPQSIVHSMVGYKDGSVIAQLGVPDMKGAIAYALSHPERLDIRQPMPDFFQISALTFEQPDMERFPCLRLAQSACKTGKTLPAVLNAANEMVVQGFMDGRLGFVDIPRVIEKTMEKHTPVDNPTLADILQSDSWARETSAILIKEKMN